jgi:hypothetical protein
MKTTILMGSDQVGVRLKTFLKGVMEQDGLQVVDVGCAADIPCDYPDYARRCVKGSRAARLMVYRAVSLMDEGHPGIMEAAMAKRFATDIAMQVTTESAQILGGYGYMKSYPVEMYMRFAKLAQIFEGTNQIQRVVIARELGNTRAENVSITTSIRGQAHRNS